MTATAVTTRTAESTSPYALTFPRAVRAEWIKLFTVRSTVWTLAITVLAMVGFSLLLAASMSLSGDVPGEIGADIAVLGYNLGQLSIAVLGCLVITGEYATGMIRSSLTAVPTRLPVLAAKAVVLAVTTFVAGVVAAVGAYLVTMPIVNGLLNDVGVEPVLTGAAVRSLFGAGLYLMAIALLSLGIGTLIRRSAGAIAAALGTILVLPTIVQIIPAQWADTLYDYLPTTAGQRIFGDVMTIGVPQTLGPWQGYGIMLAWVAVVGVGAALALRRRDA